MKRDITIFRFFTFFYLPRIIHIHCIGETIMCLSDCLSLIPRSWLISWFPATQRGYARTPSHMCFTKGSPWQRWLITRRKTLTLIQLSCSFHFPCFFPPQHSLLIVAKVVLLPPRQYRGLQRILLLGV